MLEIIFETDEATVGALKEMAPGENWRLLTRCEDCRHFDRCETAVWCRKHEMKIREGFFCADGCGKD